MTNQLPFVGTDGEDQSERPDPLYDQRLDGHLMQVGRRGGPAGGFYARLDDGSLIEHIPTDDGYEVRIKTGITHDHDTLKTYAGNLKDLYHQLK